MDVMLQNHNAKHVCDIPDGLRELCADISREVMRSQPRDICCFIAEYLDTLLITRENAKVAIKVVQNVTVKSEQIVEILMGTGLELREIAAAAPQLQKAFRAYLNDVDSQKKECGCVADDYELDDQSEVSICKILRQTGTSIQAAQSAAIKIQALFRGHYERMFVAEKRGEIQWQRAAVNTMDILRKAGITETEASLAASIIQAAYRQYYTRKNLKHKNSAERGGGYYQFNLNYWLNMMFENSGLTFERANEAAIIIQRTYRRYREMNQLTLPSHISQEITKISEKAERHPLYSNSDASSISTFVHQKPSDSRSQMKSLGDTTNGAETIRDVSESEKVEGNSMIGSHLDNRSEKIGSEIIEVVENTNDLFEENEMVEKDDTP